METAINSQKSAAEITEIRKRDGKVVPFDITRIENAVFRAFQVTKEGGEQDAGLIARRVHDVLKQLKQRDLNFLPAVEQIQDLVEKELIINQFPETAKSYILYREKHAMKRKEVGSIPERLRNLVDESKKYFKNSLSEFIYYRSYARWIEEEGRRETWVETVDRYVSFMKEKLGDRLTPSEYAEVREGILKHEAMPSMRLMQFAGTAARSTNVCAYNCSYIAPRSFQDFAEIMYISMCGTGVGWSVESENIQSLPQVKRQIGKKHPTYVIPDNKEGWADALALGMKIWFEGEDIDFDFSRLRAAGTRLKTMGGKSSGPEPLRNLLEFTRERIFKRQGRRISNIDAHDIICKIGDCVVSGGVRRSAMISLSDLDDEAIRDAKKGQFYVTDPQRSLANNSSVYWQRPTSSEFFDEWTALVKSGSGERGIFNRGGLVKTLPKRRLDQFYGGIYPSWGTNPCGEIVLQSKQFCNLTEVVARADDTEESLLRKARIATILGTYQSMLTYFPYLSREWRENCEAERLLGVSITGQWDSPAVRNEETLAKIKEKIVEVNKEYSSRFNINQSTCTTCVKPSGTVSQLVDCASGMHARHSQYYVRRIRISATDTLFKMLKDQGVPFYPEVGQTMDSATTFVLEFPVKAPDGAIFRDDLSAMDQLKYWKLVKENYTEHNPSVTVTVGDDEWIAVANWIYENWDIIGGLSFLPRSNHVYRLAPYESISKEEYEARSSKLTHVDFAKIYSYEAEDETELKRELACAGGVCEIET